MRRLKYISQGQRVHEFHQRMFMKNGNGTSGLEFLEYVNIFDNLKKDSV
jgi:hypothetical protein